MGGGGAAADAALLFLEKKNVCRVLFFLAPLSQQRYVKYRIWPGFIPLLPLMRDTAHLQVSRTRPR